MHEEKINFLNQPVSKECGSQRTGKRWIFLIILLLIGSVLAVTIVRSMLTKNVPQDPIEYDPFTLEPKKPEGLLEKITYFVFTRDYELAGMNKDRINILLIGMGGIGHDGPFLADTMIILSIKPSTGQMAMVSVPRDLGVKIPDHGWYKINHANAFGEAQKPGYGSELAVEVAENTFDIDIHYYIRIDFQAFIDIIDEIGGLKIDVERAFVDHMYPSYNNEYQTIEFAKGVQLMDGARALQYVRSRHGSNSEASDFARARRQQKVIAALKGKLLSFSTLANPVRINNIRKSLDKHFSSNLEFADIMAFLRLSKEVQSDKITTVVLDNGQGGYLQVGYSPSGAYILEPITGDFKRINKMIDNIFEQGTEVVDSTPAQPAPELEKANIEILNGTWIPGMAARMRKRLENKEFVITTIGNAEAKPIANSGIYQISTNSLTNILSDLQRELKIPIKQTPPNGIVATSTTDILVLIGEDIEE